MKSKVDDLSKVLGVSSRFHVIDTLLDPYKNYPFTPKTFISKNIDAQISLLQKLELDIFKNKIKWYTLLLPECIQSDDIVTQISLLINHLLYSLHSNFNIVNMVERHFNNYK